MRTSVLAFAAATAVASLASAALVPLSTFGNGDGWRAPNEIVTGDAAGTDFSGVYGYLATGSAERGFAYNPVTGHLLLVSRQNKNGFNRNIRILDGSTGADLGSLLALGDAAPGIVTGGTFPINMIGVADDGAIYAANLSGSGTDNFRVYRFADESAVNAPTLANSSPHPAGRTGDTFGVFGSGANTIMAGAGSTAAASQSNFRLLRTVDGVNYTGTSYGPVAGASTGSNDYRLGTTFIDADTLIGNQGTTARITDFDATTATITASVALGAAQRPMDYAVIGGIPLLAVVDSNSSLVQIFNITNPAAPVLFDSANATSGALTANGNGVGNVQWGAIVGDTATLYAMSANQGIQAFSFAIPEPASLSLLAAAGMMLRRRR